MNESNIDMRHSDTILYASLKTLRPDDVFWIDGGNIVFQDTTKRPSDSAIADAVAIESDNWVSDNYKRVRSHLYPNIGDQLDDLFHAGAFSNSMANKIQEVKDIIPK